jgi:hypothetical protein
VTELANSVYSQKLLASKLPLMIRNIPHNLKALVLKEELHFSALMESPDSENGTDFRHYSVSTRSTPSHEDGDMEMYLMELTLIIRCIAKSDDSSTETLISRSQNHSSTDLLTEKRTSSRSDLRTATLSPPKSAPQPYSEQCVLPVKSHSL